MREGDTPVVLISGPVGVGKTTVAQELSELLERSSIPHTFIDFDNLRATYPRAADDRWGNRLALDNLSEVWLNCSRAGSKNLIIADVVETRQFLREIQTAIPHAQLVTCQLSASVAELENRVRRRELGSGLEWHVKRSAELAGILERADVPCDFRIVTDGRSVAEIAGDMVDLVPWVRGQALCR